MIKTKVQITSKYVLLSAFALTVITQQTEVHRTEYCIPDCRAEVTSVPIASSTGVDNHAVAVNINEFYEEVIQSKLVTFKLSSSE